MIGGGMDSTRRRAYLRAFWQLVVLLVIIFVLVYVLSFILHRVPPRYSRFIDAAAVALVAYLSVRILVSYLNSTLTGILGRTRVHPVIFVVRMIGYFVMALAILAALGINVSSIILGSTFLAAVIGLASQSVLANQFAGLLIIITKPFKIGDRVWIHAWQFSIAYGVIAPPKYYSSDFLYNNGFVGTVEDISINYTTLVTDGGEVVKIANNVLTRVPSGTSPRSLWSRSGTRCRSTLTSRWSRRG